MTLNPTKSRRTVMVDIKTTNPTQPEPNPTAFPGTGVITCIQLIADDGVQVTEAVFSGASECALLRDFWGAVRRSDVFYGYQVVDRLVLLRRRTWVLGSDSVGAS